jgi:hypothetical protein
MHSQGGRHGRAHTFSRQLLVAAASLSLANCSVLVEADREQCSTTQDCVNRGPAFARSVCSDALCVQDPVWGCVGSVVWPSPPPMPSPEKVTVKLALSNLLTKAVVPGATARVCGKLDSKCDSPLQSDIISDESGILTVVVDKFFDGYLEIRYQVPPLFMAETMYFFNPPVEKDRMIPFIPLVPFEAIEVFADVLGMMPKLDRGTVIGLSSDCSGNGAEGIELLVDASDEFTKGFYMVQGFPSLNATKTDSSGQGGIANVVSGARFVSGRRTDTGEVIGTVSVQVRPLWITYTSMLPTPNSMQK